MIKVLCRNEEDYKNLIKSVKYFEDYIKNKFKEEKNFQLFSDNMLTIMTVGIYILINDENNINNLCKSEEDALLGFLGIKTINSMSIIIRSFSL